MLTIEAERDALKEQTLKKCILQGKIRLTGNIRNDKRQGRKKKGKSEMCLVKCKLKGKEKKSISIMRYVEKHIYLELIYNKSVIYQYY